MVDSSAIISLAYKAITSLIEEGRYLNGVGEQVRGLQREFKWMQHYLQAEDDNPHLTRQILQLRDFTVDIRELAFRAEDAIDTYIHYHRDNEKYVRKLWLIARRPSATHDLLKEIGAIQQEIPKVKERFQTFGILPNNTSNGNASRSRPIPEDWIHLDDRVVVGIDDAITQLEEHLKDPNGVFKVVAIVGTGGAGKTTLATKLYRKVGGWFSHKAFVSISQEWNKEDILNRIFEQVNKRGDGNAPSQSVMVEQLRHLLKNKRCLIVLDDIWHKEAWNEIYPILPRSKGCRVVLTTRIRELPLHVEIGCITHEPQPLTNGQMWELFSKLAIGGRVHIENDVDFEKLGKQMLEKCKGLPLAVVTLAGILRTKQQLYQWKGVNEACTEYILKEEAVLNYGAVKHMIELSYIDLPSYLKPCFLYLAIFPEDFDISATMLIRLWIAEGFITNDMQLGQEELEHVAMRSLDELHQRCILQVTRRNVQGHIQVFRLHDLLREFCIDKAKEHNFLGIISSANPDGSRTSQPRRIAVLHPLRKLGCRKNWHLRTMVEFGPVNQNQHHQFSFKEIHNPYKLLRVLIMRSSEHHFRRYIGSLVHLRYLGFQLSSNKKQYVLPGSVRSLRNLLYLECSSSDRYITSSIVIPSHLFRNMENLRGLVLPAVNSDLTKSLGFDHLKNLQALSIIAGMWMIKELPTLSCTLQSLKIHDVTNNAEIEAIYQCLSINNDHLHTLNCASISKEWVDASLEFDILKLGYCESLWSLDLQGLLLTSSCTPVQFPPNLVELRLSFTYIHHLDDTMQALGKLSKLKYLSLYDCAYKGNQLSCTGGAFPRLQELELVKLNNLKEWRMEEGVMPRLTKIRICKCMKLERLPASIRSITTLKELDIEDMRPDFYSRLGLYEAGEGEDSYIIEHIPSIKPDHF